MKELAKRMVRSLGWEISRRQEEMPPDRVGEFCRSHALETLPLVDLDAYRAANAPLVTQPIALPSSFRFKGHASMEEAVASPSAGQYFRFDEDRGVRRMLADEERVYLARQRMLYSVYARHLGGLRGKSVLDVGCSSGYYCFHGARLGAARMLGVDARSQHEDEFRLFRAALGLDARCEYHHVDMEFDLETLRETFDVVLSMGVMYHVYDHPRFVRNMFRLTRQVLVLDSACSGRSDLLCKADLEPVDNLRHSVHGPVLYPSAAWIVELMRWAGFRRIEYVPFPENLPDDGGYAALWRIMLVGTK